MAALRVAEVALGDASGGETLEAFHAVPAGLYADQPPGTAPSRAAIERNLTRGDFAGQQRALVALDGTRAVGRVVARVSPVLRDGAGKPIGMLGFFESRDDTAVAETLFRAGA